MYEDIQGMIRSCKLKKDAQYNSQKKQDENTICFAVGRIVSNIPVLFSGYYDLKMSRLSISQKEYGCKRT